MRQILLFLIVCYACFVNLSAQDIGDPIVASVKSQFISLSDFEKRYTNYLIATGIKDNYPARKSVLNNMINEILLYNYDDNKSVFEDDEYMKELEWTNKQVKISFLKDQEVYAKLTASEEELRDAFIKSNEEIAARHLYASTYDEAQNLYQLLQIGISFDSLAKQTFTDSTLRNNGGYLGFFKWGDMDAAFEEAVFSMKVGEISEPVKTAYGYSIIKLEERFTNPLLTEYEFQNQKSSLERGIKIRKKIPAEREYLNSIFEKDKIVFNEKALNNIVNDFSGKFINNPENISPQGKSDFCVKYENRIYSQQEIEERLNGIPVYHRKKLTDVDRIKEAIEGLLIQQELLALAKTKGYDKSPIVADAFKQLRTNLFMNYKRKDVLNKWEIPDSLVTEYYKNNINQFTTSQEINVQEIIVDDKKLADSLFTLLQNGESFQELAIKYSLREWSAKNGGILGLAPLSKFGIFKHVLWNTSSNQIVGPLQIENLYGIFRVLEKKESVPIDISLIKDEVKSMAKKERQNSVFIEYLDTLRDKFEIFIDEQILSNFKINLDSN